MRTAVATLLAVGLVACGSDAPAGPLVADGACAVPEPQTVQGGSHLLGDTEPPVPYLSDPPTSGWHTSGGGPRAGAYATAVSETAQVAVLERGGVVLTLDPGLSRAETGALLALVDDLGGTDLVVTPHVRSLPTPVTLTGWGVLARCDADVTATEVAAFVAEHADGPGH